MKAIIKLNSTVVVHEEHARAKFNRTERQLENEANLTRENKGFMSTKMKSKVKGNIDTLLFISELPESKKLVLNSKLGYKQKMCSPTLATFTLPSKQIHDDNFIKRYLLNRLIKLLKDKYGVILYLWVMEPQINGNAHFHILLDKFIENVTEPKYATIGQELTRDWNKILEEYGYIEPYRQRMKALHKEGFCYNPKETKEVYNFSKITGRYEVSEESVDFEAQFKAYQYGVETDWSQPNSADIHAIKQKDNIKAYICKYMTKSDGSDQTKRKINGRLWGCSDELRKVCTYEQKFDADLQDTFTDMRADNEKNVTTILVTELGNMDLQTFEDNELAGKIKVFAEIYSYSQLKFWQFAPDRFKKRFEAFYRDAFESIYTDVGEQIELVST